MKTASRDQTVVDIGELGVVRLFKRMWHPKRPILQKYDDAWAFKIGRTFVTISTDMLVERTDVPPEMTYELAARKAVVMSSSDISSKGHAPVYHLASIGLRSNTTSKQIHQVFEGIKEGVSECGGELIAGDTNEAGELTINMTSVGLSENKPVPRTLGREGDIVATTGKFGGPPAGLLILISKARAPEKGRKKLLEYVLRPIAQTEAGVSLSAAGVLSGSTDSSDGLSASLHNMVYNSGRGVILEHIPYVDMLNEFAALNRLDPLDLALNGGEEYHLVLSIKRDMWNRALEVADENQFELHRVGKVVSNKGLWILDANMRRRSVPRGGWLHFEKREAKKSWISMLTAHGP
ncbi:MAG TPA: thiamine-phosphate kinase [Thermoproteota archaeon]|nr:thiamine-phosphate kinase [Thermoproteota archaeon]